ncbi:MAG: pitrilysin family protein [Candidatus Diapherotrites archaeon]
MVFLKKATDSVTIQILVNVGSNYEKKGIRGISHFMEHMLFEGTTKRKTSTAIANEIEKLGGEFNAYTSNEKTCFYIKVAKKHFRVALDILSDIVQNPTFNEDKIEKEKKVILKEINMASDDPRDYQWSLFMKKLFNKHPAKYHILGLKEDVLNITQKQLFDYFNEFYVPNNMIVSIVGNVNNPISLVSKKFSKASKKMSMKTKISEYKQKKPRKIVEQRKILNSYLILGYQTIGSSHKDTYVLDVIRALLARGGSGKIVEEIRNKRGLAYEVNIRINRMNDTSYFAIYLNTDKSNISKAIRIIMKQISLLSNITKNELDDAKGYIEGKFILGNESTSNLANDLGYWEALKSAKLHSTYIKKIKSVTQNDVAKVAKKYLNKNYTLAIIKQK